VVALLGGALSLRAQSVTLTVTGLPANFPNPDGSAFEALAIVYATNTTYTVTAGNWNPNRTHTETIQIACSLPCPVSGPKALATLQWRRTGDATWHTLTTSYVTVETFALSSAPGNRSPTYSNAIQWQFLLNWATDPPGALTTFAVSLQLTQT
jgi:hypothetical protein